MSHGFLDFADFDGAWRYSSSPSINTATPVPIASAGKPTLVYIRAPASRSLPLSRPSEGSLATRRRTQSDTTADFSFEQGAEDVLDVVTGAERPISAILVSFAPVSWTAGGPHPGQPADVSRGEENEAVSPKSRVPGALMKQQTGKAGSVTFEIAEAHPGRLGSSLEAVKSPYPLSRGKRVERRVRGWLRRAGKLFAR